MNKLLILFLFFLFYGCSNPVVMLHEGEHCNYDTECIDGLSCINKICSNRQECVNHSDCIGKESCTDNSCLCKLGSCTPYFPCESSNLCKEKEICNEVASYPFYECICDENYKKDNDGVCEFDCTSLEHSHVNSSNSGCSCDAGYIPEDGKCNFNCSDFPLKETNTENNGCSCKPQYRDVDGECIFICNGEHSEVNDINNGCNCKLGYWQDESGDCKYDCSEDANSIANDSNDGCICKDGYQFKNGLCTFICGENSTINETNDGCNCNTGYFPNEIECLNPCSDDSCGDLELCVATSYNEFHCELADRCDPNPCLNGATCTNGATTYICNCTLGFIGTNCEMDIERKYCALSGKIYEGQDNIDTDIEYSIKNNFNTNSFVAEKTVPLDVSNGEISLPIDTHKMNWGGDRSDMTLIFKNSMNTQVLKLFLDLNDYRDNNHWYLYDTDNNEIMHVSGRKSGYTYGGSAIGNLKIDSNKIEFVDTTTTTRYSIKEFLYNIDLSSVKSVTITLNALGTYSGSGGAKSCITIPYCGNGVKQSDEDCDDGNTIDGDGCSSICEVE